MSDDVRIGGVAVIQEGDEGKPCFLHEGWLIETLERDGPRRWLVIANQIVGVDRDPYQIIESKASLPNVGNLRWRLRPLGVPITYGRHVSIEPVLPTATEPRDE